MKKVIFVLDHKLHHYRTKLFHLLANRYDITVIHRGPKLDGNFKFNQAIHDYFKIGPFELIGKLNVKQYDVVVYMQNMRLINVAYNLIINNKGNNLLWGIGASSSQGLNKESKLSKFFRNLITYKSNGLALYSSFPINSYWRVNKNKISVVGNSVDSPFSFDSSSVDKEYILFIGTLNKRKGLIDLLIAYKNSLITNKDLKLMIVGDGPEFDVISKKIIELDLVGKAEMLGSITCTKDKSELISKSYFVISPLQAGLGIVECFSFGVPFITSKYAITGGETLSIKNNVNGVLLDEDNELSDVINSFFDGRRCHKELGKQAYRFYEENLTMNTYIKKMAQFIDDYGIK